MPSSPPSPNSPMPVLCAKTPASRGYMNSPITTIVTQSLRVNTSLLPCYLVVDPRHQVSQARGDRGAQSPPRLAQQFTQPIHLVHPFTKVFKQGVVGGLVIVMWHSHSCAH